MKTCKNENDEKKDVECGNQGKDEECEMKEPQLTPEERFSELFGQPPREAQKTLLSKLVDLEANVLLLNLHTGVGKSCLGTFFGRQNPKDKLLYICSNKTLQHQIVSECKHKFPNVGSSFVLYGKRNYFCTERVEELLKNFQDMQSNNTVEKSKIYELAHDIPDTPLSIYRFLEILKLDVLKEGAIDFSFSMEDTYRMKNKLLSENGFERIWNYVSCTACKKKSSSKDKCLPCCLHRRAYDIWKESDVRIINSYTFFTVANIHEMIFEKYILDNVTRIVMDEAHTLDNVASSYIVTPNLPSKPFALKELHDFLKLCLSRRIPLFKGHVASEALEHAFRVKKSSAKHLIMNSQECKRYISISVDTTDYDVKVVKESVKLFEQELKNVKRKHNWKEEDNSEENLEFVVDEDEEAENTVFTNQKAQQLYEEYLKDPRRSQEDQRDSASHSFLKDLINHIDEVLPQIGELARMLLDETTRFSFSELMNNVHLIIKWVDRVILLSLSMNCPNWIASEWKYIVPSISFESEADAVMFTFDYTWQFAAEKFKEKIWDRISIPVVLMSASVQNVLDQTDPYALFLNNVGLQTSQVQKYTSPHVFDVKRNLRIYWPKNDVYVSSMEYRQKRELQMIVTENICEFARKNPRCTLIISQKDDMRNIIMKVRMKLKDFLVVNFEDEPDIFEKHSENKIIVFGSDKMCQGLNKPSRIGGMLICRKLNFHVQSHLKSYMSSYLMDGSYWDRFDYVRLNREYQAIGRILRCETDFGCIGLLSHDLNEVSKIQRYFAPELLNIDRDSPIWPEDPAKEEDVEVTGERSWEEKDAELRSRAVTID